jgi:hypothetical protein
MDIGKILINNLPDDVMQKAAQMAGIDTQAATGVMQEMAPSLLTNITKKAGADNSFIDNALSMLQSGNTDVLQSIFGSQLGELSQSVAGKFGINPQSIIALLSGLLPTILGLVKSGAIPSSPIDAASGIAGAASAVSGFANSTTGMAKDAMSAAGGVASDTLNGMKDATIDSVSNTVGERPKGILNKILSLFGIGKK